MPTIPLLRSQATYQIIDDNKYDTAMAGKLTIDSFACTNKDDKTIFHLTELLTAEGNSNEDVQQMYSKWAQTYDQVSFSCFLWT